MNVDIVMMVAILALCVGLVPQIIENFRSKKCGVVLKTAVVITVALWVLVGCFFSMGLWFSSVGCLIQGTLWAVMLGQLWVYRPRPARCGDCRHYWLVNEKYRITKKSHWREYVCGRFTERKGGE